MRAASGTFGPLSLRCEASFAWANVGIEPVDIRTAVKNITEFVFIFIIVKNRRVGLAPPSLNRWAKAHPTKLQATFNYLLLLTDSN